MEEQRIKFALIGCGHIGKRHAEMISRNPECELLALADVKPKEELGLKNFDVPFFHPWLNCWIRRLMPM